MQRWTTAVWMLFSTFLLDKNRLKTCSPEFKQIKKGTENEYNNQGIASTFTIYFSPASSFNSVDAVDDALTQLINDGSALQHTIAQQTNEGISADNLRAISDELTKFEATVANTVKSIDLDVGDTEQPGYKNLLDDSVRLSSQIVKLSNAIANLVTKVESDSSGQYQNTLETMIHAMLRLSDDIGIMADRILFTEEQIGIMADRIGEMADRILETQRIQNENIARIHDISQQLLTKFELDKPEPQHNQIELMQESREIFKDQQSLPRGMW